MYVGINCIKNLALNDDPLAYKDHKQLSKTNQLERPGTDAHCTGEGNALRTHKLETRIAGTALVVHLPFAQGGATSASVPVSSSANESLTTASL